LVRPELTCLVYEAPAKAQLEAKGYTGVRGLTSGTAGNWAASHPRHIPTLPNARTTVQLRIGALSFTDPQLPSEQVLVAEVNLADDATRSS
jgi:hypothetical protein